jgi:hypothetical protein
MHCILSIIVLNVACRVEGDGIQNRVSKNILKKHEDPIIKFYSSGFFTGKMCNNKHRMMAGHEAQSIYHGPTKARGEILNPLA